MIRKATYKDIDSILEITRACAVFLNKNGVIQWNESYPSKDVFKNDVLREELYVLEHETEIVGCIVISTYMDDEYTPINWLTPNRNNIYIHRLAVHPNRQGKGMARELMDFAETWAKKSNFTSIRLDTLSQNLRNQKFYELRNYKRVGEIHFPNQSEFPFYCYEFVL
ncbi:GNAT family N-acetyltransferase [Xanthomarina sp.]|uniref:GNAT family N-acetyltransferase n=1 Tax=Xanthomarina sp. TaxID=1931211 RepID=UPI002B5BCAD5|nr:GNAT family N-acetyltransferase [Xanthomarina sp.]HLV38401.1 GNAT family N-acetyltransferase [Xanthomarina sp.]